MDTHIFFREATLRICGSLDVETFLYESFLYIRDFIPAQEVALMYFDIEGDADDCGNRKGRQVLLASASSDGGVGQNISVPQPHEVLRFVNQSDENTLLFNCAEDALITQPWIELGLLSPQASILTLRLILGHKLIGAVNWISHTPRRFTRQHAALIEVLREPFAIALSNSIRYKKLRQFQDLLVEDNRFLRQELQHRVGEEIIGADFGLKHVMEMAQQVAPQSSPVLLLGETGTGKEVIAGAIHHLSARNRGPFITVNCGAIPENLVDSELFGHEKGAFTGAISSKKGRFERADGGTIFLDEVGELKPDAQVRLLRALQEKEIERVGGSGPIRIDSRVIAATHRDLKDMIRKGSFREDLFFRLNVFPISIPPLRERTEDIPALLQYFLRKKSREMGRKLVPPPAPGVLERLSAYSWPGNVRELQNAVERELIINRGSALNFREIFEAASALPYVARENAAQENFSEPRQPDDVRALDEVIARHIRRTLTLSGGKVGGPGGAADLLRVNPSTLRKRMKKLGIPFGRHRHEAE